MEKVLMHFRTKGSKNGERLYQYEDGTWTTEGKERRRAEYRRMSGRDSGVRRAVRGVAAAGTAAGLAASTTAGAIAISKNQEEAFKPGKDGKASKAEKIFREQANAVDASTKLTESLTEVKNKKAFTDDLTNAELRQMIDRMNLEKQYSQLMAEDVNKGKDFFQTVMPAVGSLASLGVSIVAILAGIKALRDK